MLVFQVTLILCMGVLFARMLYLQWYQHEGLLLQANQNRINVVPVLPTRGEIQDRFATGLAVNKVSYRLEVIPERVDDMPGTLNELQALMGWNEQQFNNIQKRIKRARRDRPVLLADKLDWSHAAHLSVRLHHLPGVDVIAGTHRDYPFAALTSHLIGYLSLARTEDLKQGYLHNESVGRSGLERVYEHALHGKPGYQKEEVNAMGRRVAVLQQSPPVRGQDLQLSLDLSLQQVASKALGERTGAVVVMDVHSGEVRVLLSQPGYDTNHFITGLEQEQWQAWLNDKRKPLLNRTTQAAYPPASTMKVITSLAGLRQHVPLATGHTQCPGYLELADRKLRCWKRTGHGSVNLHDSLVHSCDVYFYSLGDQLGMKPLVEEARLWGMGERTGIDLSPETRGNVPEVMQHLSNGRVRDWPRGVTMITAIGQGEVTVSPLQMARFAAAVANGGDVLKPQLLAGQEPVIVRHVDIAPNYLHTVRQAMRDVVKDIRGTGHASLSRVPWAIAGKTGTAQVVAMAQDDEEEDDSPVLNKHKDHAWFMGYAPYEDPRIAVAVLVEHGGHGGSDAGPVAGAIVRALAAREAEQMHE